MSILHNPPRGTELAARVAILQNAQPEPSRDFADHPVLRETAELYEVMREPRSWKLPTDLVARHVLPSRFRTEYGEKAAAALNRNPDLALAVAEQFQQLDYLSSSAAKRAKEPPSDLHALVLPIIYAEFLSVRARMSAASANRHYEVTGINLGGPRQPIDRNAIRRAVEKFPRRLFRLPERQINLVLLSIMVFQDEFSSRRAAA